MSFQETFGERPGFIEAIAYDTAMMLFHVIRKSDIGYPLRDNLVHLRSFRGVTGLTSFDENGDARKILYLLQVKGNRFVELKN